MSPDTSHLAQNDAARQRLKDLVNRMSEEDLKRPLGDGWTISACLAHLAFYDYRAVALLDDFARTGEVVESPLDVDIINHASLPLCLAIPPRVACDMAVTAAEAADRRVAELSEAALAQLQAAGSPINLLRAEHRDEHLGQIEAVL